jgi:NTE family protein
MDAVWASIALPGLFQPFEHKGQWMLDGGLVNPVPVSLCRALGAEVIIAVNLNGTVSRRYVHHTNQLGNGDKEVGKPAEKPVKNGDSLMDTVTASLREYSSAFFPAPKNKEFAPGLLDAIAGSINIMQDKITRSRMAGDPPEILLTPRLENMGLLEFYRAEEAIAEGRKTVVRMQAEISDLLNL